MAPVRIEPRMWNSEAPEAIQLHRALTLALACGHMCVWATHTGKPGPAKNKNPGKEKEIRQRATDSTYQNSNVSEPRNPTNPT